MAYSEELADRVCDAIDARPGMIERKMFGGVAWMVNGNMAYGIVGEDLMVRLERDETEAAQTEEHVGRPDHVVREDESRQPSQQADDQKHAADDLKRADQVDEGVRRRQPVSLEGVPATEPAPPLRR